MTYDDWKTTAPDVDERECPRCIGFEQDADEWQQVLEWFADNKYNVSLSQWPERTDRWQATLTLVTLEKDSTYRVSKVEASAMTKPDALRKLYREAK